MAQGPTVPPKFNEPAFLATCMYDGVLHAAYETYIKSHKAIPQLDQIRDRLAQLAEDMRLEGSADLARYVRDKNAFPDVELAGIVDGLGDLADKLNPGRVCV